MPATTDRPTTGYQTKDGTHKRPIRFYLTDAEWRDFLRAKAEAGHTDNSAFIVEALGLATEAGTAEATTP